MKRRGKTTEGDFGPSLYAMVLICVWGEIWEGATGTGTGRNEGQRRGGGVAGGGE